MATVSVPPPPLFKFFRYIEANKARYISCLREVVAIPSVSRQPEHRADVLRMLYWTEERFKKLGLTTEMCATTTDLKSKQQPPPVLLASLTTGSNKRRVLVYLHVDVAEVTRPEEWTTDPFTLEDQPEGTLQGRGTQDCKGPLVCWLSAMDAMLNLSLDVFCNLKFIVDGALEMGSPGLEDLLRQRRNTFFRDVDVVCVSDGCWLGERVPCVTYGLRGLCYFQVEVAGAKSDLHSGEFGGLVQEPLVDLIYLLNAMQDSNGHPNIPGLNKDVVAVTPDEEKLYDNVDFRCEELRGQVGVRRLRFFEDMPKVLMHSWRYPSLSFHGVEGANDGPEICTSIPRKVVGKFSIRIVPNQNPEKVSELVKQYLANLWAARKSPNYMCVESTVGVRSWLESPWSQHYEAARRAVKRVHKLEPDLVRDGSTMNSVLVLQRTVGKSIVLLPMGSSCGDGAHGVNERCMTKHFTEGIKMMGAYLYEVSQIKRLK